MELVYELSYFFNDCIMMRGITLKMDYFSTMIIEGY